MNEIRTHAERLKIPPLLHFTRTENLASILRYGLYPKSNFAELPHEPSINDQFRLDGHEDAVSVSIGHPNRRMFFKLRKENPNTNWAVLMIAPSVLWQKNCAFCHLNAADSRVSGLSRESLQTPESFMSIFEGEGRAPYLKAYDPTDEQAEVLVFDKIEPAYIGGVIFDSNETMQTFSHLTEGLRTSRHLPDRGIFASRSYRRQWG